MSQSHTNFDQNWNAANLQGVLYNLMSILAEEKQKSLNYFRIAWQSALAAGFCLGVPAGLSLWLILLQRTQHVEFVKPLVDVLNAHGLYSIYILTLSSILWSYLLGRISGYRPWGWIAVATALGILTAWFSP